LIVGEPALGDDGDLVLARSLEREIVGRGDIFHDRERMNPGIDCDVQEGHAAFTLFRLDVMHTRARNAGYCAIFIAAQLPDESACDPSANLRVKLIGDLRGGRNATLSPSTGIGQKSRRHQQMMRTNRNQMRGLRVGVRDFA
jgi:hypothetical protein